MFSSIQYIDAESAGRAAISAAGWHYQDRLPSRGKSYITCVGTRGDDAESMIAAVVDLETATVRRIEILIDVEQKIN